MSSIDSESFKSIRQFFLTKIKVFCSRGEVHERCERCLAKHQSAPNRSKIKVWSSLTNFNLSDCLHNLRIRSGHEFYRFREFQIHPTIFSYKKQEFLIEGGARKISKLPPKAPSRSKSIENQGLELVDQLKLVGLLS